MTRSIPKRVKQLALCAALSLGCATANAALVFSDDFNANNFGAIWTVTDGNVDVGNYPDLCNNGAGGYCVDTEGTGDGSNATFQLITPLASLVAGSYAFAFDWGNNDGLDHPNGGGTNVLGWQITSDQGLLASGSVNSGSFPDFTYANASFSFSVASPVTNAVIRFQQTGFENDWGGTVLDNVKLDLVSAAQVPAPATVLLLGLGLLGLGLGRRKR